MQSCVIIVVFMWIGKCQSASCPFTGDHHAKLCDKLKPFDKRGLLEDGNTFVLRGKDGRLDDVSGNIGPQGILCQLSSASDEYAKASSNPQELEKKLLEFRILTVEKVSVVKFKKGNKEKLIVALAGKKELPGTEMAEQIYECVFGLTMWAPNDTDEFPVAYYAMGEAGLMDYRTGIYLWQNTLVLDKKRVEPNKFKDYVPMYNGGLSEQEIREYQIFGLVKRSEWRFGDSKSGNQFLMHVDKGENMTAFVPIKGRQSDVIAHAICERRLEQSEMDLKFDGWKKIGVFNKIGYFKSDAAKSYKKSYENCAEIKGHLYTPSNSKEIKKIQEYLITVDHFGEGKETWSGVFIGCGIFVGIGDSQRYDPNLYPYFADIGKTVTPEYLMSLKECEDIYDKEKDEVFNMGSEMFSYNDPANQIDEPPQVTPKSSAPPTQKGDETWTYVAIFAWLGFLILCLVSAIYIRLSREPPSPPEVIIEAPPIPELPVADVLNHGTTVVASLQTAG